MVERISLLRERHFDDVHLSSDGDLVLHVTETHLSNLRETLDEIATSGSFESEIHAESEGGDAIDEWLSSIFDQIEE